MSNYITPKLMVAIEDNTVLSTRDFIKGHEAVLVTPEGKIVEIIQITGKPQEFLIKGDLETIVESRKSLLDTLKLNYPKRLSDKLEAIVESERLKYEKLFKVDTRVGTWAIQRLSSDNAVCISKNKEITRGWDNAFRWLLALINLQAQGEYTIKGDKIYFNLRSGKSVIYKIIQITKQNPSLATYNHYNGMWR